MRLGAGLAASAVAGVAVAGTLAAGPHPAQRALVAGAIRRYVATSGCCATSRFAVPRIRISATDPDFASADLLGWDAAGTPIQGAVAVLRRDAGTWKVLDIGTDSTGCGIPAPAVRRELRVSCDEG